MSYKVQCNYDDLQKTMQSFVQEASQTEQLFRSVSQCVQRLQGGDWVGVGANSFFEEMQNLVLPGVSRLARTLQDAAQATSRISDSLRQAEEEAGSLFRGDGDGAMGTVGQGTGAGAGAGGGFGAGVPGGAGGGGGGGVGIGFPGGGGFGGGGAGGRGGGGAGAGAGGTGGAGGSKDYAKNLKSLKFKEDLVKPSRKLSDKKFGDQFTKKDGFFANNVEAKVKLAGGDLGKVGVAVYEKDFGFGKFEALSAEASAKWGVDVGKGGFKAGVSGDAGAYLARVQASGQVAGVDLAGQAYVGANAKGELAAVLKPGQAYVGAGAEAFVGGKAEGTIKKSFDVGGIPASVGASGDVRYGIGVEADAKFGYDNGKVKFGGKVGAALGLGAGVKFEVEVDAKKAVNTVVDAGKSAVSAVGNFFGF